jgi:hypothetical protein
MWWLTYSRTSLVLIGRMDADQAMGAERGIGSYPIEIPCVDNDHISFAVFFVLERSIDGLFKEHQHALRFPDAIYGSLYVSDWPWASTV